METSNDDLKILVWNLRAEVENLRQAVSQIVRELPELRERSNRLGAAPKDNCPKCGRIIRSASGKCGVCR
jgi:hypothetical protein